MTSKATKRMPAHEPDSELGLLLEDAASAPPETRIEYRDRVAAHGAEAVAAMEAWVEQGRSPGFAIAVLEAVGKSADDLGAAQALRRIAGKVPDWADIAQQALARIGASGRATAAGQAQASAAAQSAAAAGGDAYMATGTPPPAEGPCTVPNRDGSACHNPGRHPVEGGWACTTHWKAATRQAEPA
jgi:hypothetical protein